MAVWLEDTWYKDVKVDAETTVRRPSARHGRGMRWRVRCDDPVAGRWAKSFTRKPDAERLRDQVRADLLRGSYTDPQAGLMTLGEYAGRWLAAQDSDPVSQERVAQDVQHITNGLGGYPLATLAANPSLIQAWVKDLPLGPRTKLVCLNTLSSVFAAAIDDGRISRNPSRAKSVRRPSPPKKNVVPLEAAQLVAVRAALPARYQAMVDAGAACGLRQGEIFGLSPADIDRGQRMVHVRRQVKVVAGRMMFSLPKGGKTRSVPLDPAAAGVFAAHAGVFPPVLVTLDWHEPSTPRHGKPVTVPLVFATPAGRAVLRQSFNRVWRAALTGAGIPATRENGMHVLRHTYASVLIHDGVDIRRVAACLGHTDAGFTLRVYSHLMAGGDDAVRRAAGKALNVVTVPGPYPPSGEMA